MVDDATHVHCGREQFSSILHADDTQARHVRTRQCVNVLDHDVYVDCDGDLDMLRGSKGSANRVLCSTWAMSPSWRATGEHQATGSASTYSITVADVDSEGDVDVLLGSVGSATNQVPLNAGDGTFSTSIRIRKSSVVSGKTPPLRPRPRPQRSTEPDPYTH